MPLSKTGMIHQLHLIILEAFFRGLQDLRVDFVTDAIAFQVGGGQQTGARTGERVQDGFRDVTICLD